MNQKTELKNSDQQRKKNFIALAREKMQESISKGIFEFTIKLPQFGDIISGLESESDEAIQELWEKDNIRVFLVDRIRTGEVSTEGTFFDAICALGSTKTMSFDQVIQKHAMESLKNATQKLIQSIQTTQTEETQSLTTEFSIPTFYQKTLGMQDNKGNHIVLGLPNEYPNAFKWVKNKVEEAFREASNPVSLRFQLQREGSGNMCWFSYLAIATW